MGQNSQGDRSADEQDQKDEAAPDCIMSPIERDPAKDCLHSRTVRQPFTPVSGRGSGC
jgi:hypothetical protein